VSADKVKIGSRTEALLYGIASFSCPTRLIRILPSLESDRRIQSATVSWIYCYCSLCFDTIRSPCSIRFELLRFSISGPRL